MFKAFGLEKTAGGPSFTGELQAESSTAQAEGDVPRDKDKASPDRDEFSPQAFSDAPAASAAPETKPWSMRAPRGSATGSAAATLGAP